jgi:hypothetical protein
MTSSSEYVLLGFWLFFEFYELGIVVYVHLELPFGHELFDCFNAFLMVNVLRYASKITGSISIGCWLKVTVCCTRNCTVWRIQR